MADEKPVEKKPFAVGDRVVVPVYNRPEFKYGRVEEISCDSTGAPRWYKVRRRDGLMIMVEFHELEHFVPKIAIVIHDGVPETVRSNDPEIEVVIFQTDSEDTPDSAKEDADEIRLAKVDCPYPVGDY